MSGESLTLTPTFNEAQRAMAIPFTELNHLLASQWWDIQNFYQNAFGVFSYMRLTKQLKHVVTTFTGDGYVWQPFNSCYLKPMGGVKSGRIEMNPCPSTSIQEQCYDEFFDSCFKSFIEFNGQGPVVLDPQGQTAFNNLMRLFMENAVKGARMVLTSGQIYDDTAIEFKDGVDAETKQRALTTHGVCEGWLKLLQRKALEGGKAHLNLPGIINGSDFTERKYEGDIQALLDKLRCEAPDKLDAVVNQGGISRFDGRSAMPIYMLSPKLWKAAVDKYNANKDNLFQNEMRFTMEMMPWRNASYKVYYYDGIPLIPISDTQFIDSCLTGSTEFAYLGVAGVVNMGASFSELPGMGNTGMGMRIHMKDNNEDLGKTSARTDSLFSTAISDDQLLVGSQEYIVPA